MTLSQLKKKLENPFALVAEGFLVGCIMFWAVSARPSHAHPAPAAATAAAQADVQAR
ncbi:MAG: hypothetical protein ACM3YM_08790 [Sphingomonadales bacterium]